MTVSFADQFDIPQVSKKYSVILKGQCLRSCGATCKLLCVSCLTEIRVMVFTTLKNAYIADIQHDTRCASWRELSDGIVPHETAIFPDDYLLSGFEQI